MSKKSATIPFTVFSLRFLIASVFLAGMVTWAVLGTASVSISHLDIDEDPKATTLEARASSRDSRSAAPDRRLHEANLPPRIRQSLMAWREFVANNFAGDEACAECHAAEYAAHQRSGHSRTLTLMTKSILASELSEQGMHKDSRREQEFTFTATADTFLVRDEANAPGIAVPVTWLVGSGIHAQTPIAVDELTQKGVELRWSSFAGHVEVGLTPDHERFDEFVPGSIECFGRPLDASDIRACLGCHSTIAAPPSIPIMQSLVIANVGCERCHGPRKDHVDLAHHGFAEQAKPMLKYENAEAYMDACAACHRDENSVHPDAKAFELARFQPYGIKRSKCYLQSDGQLTCSTCHDPHDTVSHDRLRSIAQCVNCHDGAHDAGQEAAGIVKAICSHEPSGDCIECHMPAVEWAGEISFHDHWIRVQ
ncbi:multiheme c-type cytochrome [Aporhodopirellula aestuarii]|uniref:Cytochrome c-552/4 domain-containing protein n=1 Tax=Aporhodopirellula aestuarii TaxID=2950107 RepID=A0ABT0U9L0_9BACT|nr:multiheme c-type cytochrome [Aporhodopirellula aestuarii]MCM2373578.1 hypothetical protein [Aporhodopirellula aestuarii]